ncbi:MAG: hypothetical protein IOMNBAOH_02832 [Rhodocyclaceae bacterium]|nr:hypothetical protein [Rhodocyclaceae bacterium]
MSTHGASGVDRTNLNFANLVKERFAFLSDLGFVEVESLPTLVLYRNGDIDVDVYHGRRSYEIGFGITRQGVRYSLSEFIRSSDPEFAEQYRYPTATTQEVLVDGLTRTAELVKRYCIKALQGNPAFFSTLGSQRKLWAEKYAFDVMVGQLRPKAHEAFRLSKYREAAELYRKIESALSPAERKKLAIAEERIKE